MADTREVKIVLETVDGSAGGTSSETERADTQANAQASKASNRRTWTAIQMFGKDALERAANEAVAWANYEIDKDFNLNDDYIGQRNLNIATQAVNWSISSASTIASSTIMGASFGPVGAAIGAAIGIGSVVAKTARANIQAMEQQQIRINQREAILDFTRQRSGWSLKAASIGENL